MIKDLAKKLIKSLPFAFTQNQKYDRQTAEVIQRSCKPNSTCIDVGCHKGEVLDMLLAASPAGKHYGFEPIPVLYEALRAKYNRPSITISNIALSNKRGETSFNYVVSNPAYSGLIKRKYDRADEQDTSIQVQTDKLDDVLPPNEQVDFVKIDVEGGELLVLQGARQMLTRCKPVVIFECGLGASEFYGSTPDMVFSLLSECGLKLSLMENWLNGRPALTQKQFEQHYQNKSHYYFIAYP
jgi:FkbM family methyltransferase